MIVDQLLILAEQIMLHVPLVLGAYISFSLLKVPDLSLESAYVTGAMIAARILPLLQGLPSGLQLVAVLFTSLFAGGSVGLLSSLLTQKAQLSHLLSCIITFGIFYGVNQLITGSYFSFSAYHNPLIFELIPKHPELIILTIVGIVVMLFVYIILRTQLGYSFAVYGNNAQFFNHYGISSSYVFIMGIVCSNMLAGLSGYFFAQANGFVEINMAFGKALLCITALILGKTCIPSQAPIHIARPLTGLFLYFSLQQILLKCGFNFKYFTAIQALVVLFILVMFRKSRNYSADNLGV